MTFGIIENNPSEYSRQRDVDELLSDIPSEVSEAYEKILSRSSSEKKATLLLQIILAAAEPLNLEEANLALTLALADDDMKSHAELESASWPGDFKAIVKNLCGLIINVYDGKLSFIHLTAREFLVRNTDAASPMRNWAGRFRDAAASHGVLTRCCMQYLLLSDFSSRILFKFEIEAEKYELLRYASGNWPSHFTALDEAGISTYLPLARQLCSTSLAPWHTWGRIYISNGSIANVLAHNLTDGWSDLAVASFIGLNTVVQALLNDGVDVNAGCRLYKSALYSAIEKNQESTVALLIANGAEVDEFSTLVGTPLDFAVDRQKSLGIIKLLIMNGASPFKESVQSDYDTILAYAAEIASKDVFYALLADLFDLSTPDTIVAASRDHRIINSGTDCLARVLDLLDDESLEEICTEETFTILASEPKTLNRIFRLIRNSTWLSVFIATQVLDERVEDPQFFERTADAFRELMLEGRFPYEQITSGILATIALHSDPETLRRFIENSPENVDLKNVFSAAVCNQTHRDMLHVVFEFAEAAISDDEDFQYNMLNGYEAERWKECVWHAVDEETWHYETEHTIATVHALLRLSHHTDRIKKCMISAALRCTEHPSSSPLNVRTEELLIAVLDRFGHTNIIDVDLLAQAAGDCDLRTLQLTFGYSSGISIIDEPILMAIAVNCFHGRYITKFLLEKYPSEVAITPNIISAAARCKASGVLALLFEMRFDEIELTVDLLVRVRDADEFKAIIERKRDQVAAIASAALHQAASSSRGDPLDIIVARDDRKAVELLLKFCPSSWFEVTEGLILDLLHTEQRLDRGVATTDITLLFEKLGDKIILTERILLEAALSPLGTELLAIFKLWKPKGLVLTPWIIKELYAGDHLEELASVADCCGSGEEMMRVATGLHTFGLTRRILSKESTEKTD